MEVNVKKLVKELQDAGIPVVGCSSNGRIDFSENATDAQKQQAQTILENHDPIWYYEQRQKEYPPIEDQLDYIYHHGLVAWKTNVIDPVKTKYPKK